MGERHTKNKKRRMVEKITMAGILTGIIGAAQGLGGLIGGIQGINASSQAAEEAKAYREQQLMLQKIQWDREDNAVQRRMKDLELAGINPLLAGVQGASSSLAPIQQDNAGVHKMAGAQNMVNAFQSGGSLMQDAIKLTQEYQVQKKQIEHIDASINKINSSIRVDNASIDKLTSETGLTLIKQAESVAGIELTNEQRKKIAQEADNLIVQKKQMYEEIRRTKNETERIKIENNIKRLEEWTNKEILKTAKTGKKEGLQFLEKFWGDLAKDVQNYRLKSGIEALGRSGGTAGKF